MFDIRAVNSVQTGAIGIFLLPPQLNGVFQIQYEGNCQLGISTGTFYDMVQKCDFSKEHVPLISTYPFLSLHFH